VFGAWTAYQLRRSGRTIALVDGYGAANSRSSSGGETRLMRAGYGADAFYTDWARASMEMWKEFFRLAGQALFEQTGVLWLAHPDDQYVEQTEQTLRAVGARCQRLSLDQLRAQFPQIATRGLDGALVEPDAGVLMARRAVRLLVQQTLKLGGVVRPDRIVPPTGSGTLDAVTTSEGDEIRGEQFVFACGPWLAGLFPDLLANRMTVTRQEVFFFGPRGGDRRFAPPQLPAWLDMGEAVYGIPDLQRRGVKFAFDRHGAPFDPDSDDRVLTDRALAEMRAFVAMRFPALAEAPLLEGRVCQYCCTSSNDFLISRHPSFTNVWLLGGGSGHGFKHGPSVAQHLVNHIALGRALDPRFSLATKHTVQQRLVF